MVTHRKIKIFVYLKDFTYFFLLENSNGLFSIFFNKFIYPPPKICCCCYYFTTLLLMLGNFYEC